MVSSRSRQLRGELPILALLGGMWCTTPALAHKLVVFATVEANTIQGEAYFRGGTPVREAKVTVVGPHGEVLGEITTDQEGKFTFDVRFRCDHKLIVNAGEGHSAEYTVSLDELPNGLPAPDTPDESPNTKPAGVELVAPAESRAERPAIPPGEAAGSAPLQQSLKADLETIDRQVAGLRKDLDKYKNQLRVQDILGGIGYILGIMGLVFYFLGVRKRMKDEG